MNNAYNAGAGSDSELAGGVRVSEGWGWTHWERFNYSLSWEEYQIHVEEKRNGKLLTMTEARELLRHQVLCPGEDCWVAVVPDATSSEGQANHYADHKHADEDESSETAPIAGKHAGEADIWGGTSLDSAKSVTTWAAAITSSQDVEVPMDWVQVIYQLSN